MTNYFKQLINKSNIFTNSLIGIIFFIFYKLIFDNALLAYLKNDKVLYYSFFTSLFLLCFASYIFIQTKKVKEKEIDINDHLLVIYNSFILMNLLYRIITFKTIWHVIFYIIFLLVNFIFIYQRTKRIKTYTEKELTNNSEQKGNFINYYYSLSHHYNLGFGFLIGFSLFAFYKYFNLSMIIKHLDSITIIITGAIIAIFFIIESLKNYRKKTIIDLDYIYFILKTFMIISLCDSLVQQDKLYQLIAISCILLIFVMITLARYKYVLGETIDEDDVFINKKKGLKIYISHYIQRYGIFTTILYSILLNIFFVILLYTNINTFLFENNKDLFIIISLLLIAMTISIIFIQIQNISSKKITYSDFTIIISCLSLPSLIYIYIARQNHLLYNYDYIVFFTGCFLALLSFIFLLIRLKYVFDEEIIEVKEILTHNLEKDITPIIIPNDEVEINKMNENNDDFTKKEPVTEDEIKKDDQLSINLLTQDTFLNQSKEIEQESDQLETNNDTKPKNESTISIIDINSDYEYYDDYFKVFKDKYHSNLISLNDFNNENNRHILASVFINFNEIKKFNLYLDSYMKRAADLSMMGLNPYDSFAMDYLLSLEPGLATDLINIKEVLIPNNFHSFYGRLKSSQPKLYKERRAELLLPILDKYNENISTILYYIFSEIRNCINEKVSKDLVKVEKGRIQSKTYFDLYLRDYDFDFNKAKRQITKFSEEYNNTTSVPDSSKCFRDFIISIQETDYFPTLLTILGQSLNIFRDKEKLLIDILKKLNTFYNIQYSQIEGIDKIAEIVKDLILSFPKKDYEKNIKILFNNTSDILFLDTVIYKFKENFGNKNYMVNLLETSMMNFIKGSIDYHVNIFENKKITKEEYHIIIHYLYSDQSFINYFKESINEKTIYNYIGLFINVRKNINTYIYELDLKNYTLFMTKSDIIKLIKNNEKSIKQQVALDLIKNKRIEAKSKIIFKK